MKVLILIYFLLFNSITTDSGHCSNAFEALLQSKCNSIKISDTKKCVYSKGKCNVFYSECSSYEGKNSTICKGIIPSKKDYKCELKNDQCTEVIKSCNEITFDKVTICSSYPTF